MTGLIEHTGLFKTVFLLLVSIGGALNSGAQDSLSVEDCINRAIKNNLEIKKAQVSQEIARSDYKQKQADLLPSVNMQFNNNYSGGRSIDPQTNNYVHETVYSLSGSASSDLTLFSGFKILNSIKLSKQEFELNGSMIAQLRNNISLDVAATYIKILYLEEIIKADWQQIEASKKQIALAELKFNKGRIAAGEVYKFKSQLATEQVQLTDNQNELAIYYLDLKQLLNIPFSQELKLKRPAAEVFPDAYKLNTDSVIAVAKRINPAMAVARMKQAKAQTALAITRAERYPVVQLGYGIGSAYSNTDPLARFRQQLRNNLSNEFVVSLSMPLFNNFRTSMAIKQNRLMISQAEVDTRIEENKLVKILLQAINDVKASSARFAAARSANEFAQKSYQADVLKFQIGAISTSDFNLSKNNFYKSQAEFFRSRYELLFRNKVIDFYLGRPLTF